MPKGAALFLCCSAFALFAGCSKDRESTSTTSQASAKPSEETATQVRAPSTPAPRYLETGDLAALRKRGRLRVLVFGGGESFLPRQGTPESYERTLVEQFAASLTLDGEGREVPGLDVEFIRAPAWDDLFRMLREGEGDLIAARVTVTEGRKKIVSFTRPVKVVSEILVGRKGAAGLPTKPGELAGKKVHVRASSSYAESLRVLSKGPAAGLEIVAVPQHLDDEQVVHRVTSGKPGSAAASAREEAYELTVIDDDRLLAIKAYNDDVQALFPVREGSQIAWAVRPQAEQLKAAADAFLIEHALTEHTRRIFAADLDGIKQRRVLRVLTRNNGVTYFLHKGRRLGFEYELAKSIAKDLGVRLEVVVPPTNDLLIPWLKEGKGDFIAASYTVNKARRAQVAFTTPYLFVDPVLVGHKNATDLPRAPSELKGRDIHVRAASSYFDDLLNLQSSYGPFRVTPIPEDQETEEILARVASGEVPLTVADSHIVAVEQTYRGDLVALFPLRVAAKGALDPIGKPREGATEIAFAVRKNAPQLHARIDTWVKQHYRGLEYNLLKKRYFDDKRQVAATGEGRLARTGRLSPHDALLKKYAKRYGLDWRLLAAQAFQESRFDPNAESWVGAQGLFQVMPETGAELGFRNLKDPEEGTHAGVKYMAQLIERFEGTLPFKERIRFALASYNAGRGHVLDARRLAREKGWNPDKWFGNVSKAMLLLKEDRYARRARHGYCRGDEPVAYVSQIQQRYDAYAKVVPRR